MTTIAPSPLATAAKTFGSFWRILLIVGIAWIVIGFIVLRFDDSTVNVISVVFGILVLLSAVNEIFRAAIDPSSFSSSVLVPVTYVSVLAIFRGVAEIGAAFTVRHVTQTNS